MARSPSARALSNRCDLYRLTGTQDADAGLAPDQYGSAFATSVPCSIQPDDPVRYLDEKTGRLMEKTPYNVFFGADYALKADDKIVGSSVDPLWTGVELIVFGTANQAGKGGAYQVTAERIQ